MYPAQFEPGFGSPYWCLYMVKTSVDFYMSHSETLPMCGPLFQILGSASADCCLLSAIGVSDLAAFISCLFLPVIHIESATILSE